MFGSETLEIAIGVVFVYLLLSLICSTISELFARAFALRSNILEDGIRTLLSDPKKEKDLTTPQSDPKKEKDLTTRLYEHPLIKGLSKQGRFDQLLKREGKPSYISSRTFALALLDIAVPPDPDGSKNLHDAKAMIGKIDESLVGKDAKIALLALLHTAEGNLKNGREGIENWFDEGMERVTGWYKRQTQLIVLGIALVVTVALNADTWAMITSYSRDATLRASVVAAAQEVVKKDPTVQSDEPALAKLQKLGDYQKELLQLPVGWIAQGDLRCSSTLPPVQVDPRCPPQDGLGVLGRFMGFLLTILAISLGAPFWFDMLSKLVNVSSGGKEPAKAATPSNTGETAATPEKP